MTEPFYPSEFLELLQAIQGKRARVVVEHILKHGFITTEDLEATYGYKHPPRAVRDVREQGIPLETFKVKNSEGRTIAAYRFADPAQIRHGKIGGRRAFPKDLKKRLIQESGQKCSACLDTYDERYLQVDHRVPYEVAGDVRDERIVEAHMLLCGSCNRGKSCSCEHCQNWQEMKDPSICQSCYWANPQSYEHVATRPLRRIDITWQGEDVGVYDGLKALAESEGHPLPDYLKNVLQKHLTRNDPS